MFLRRQPGLNNVICLTQRQSYTNVETFTFSPANLKSVPALFTSSTCSLPQNAPQRLTSWISCQDPSRIPQHFWNDYPGILPGSFTIIEDYPENPRHTYAKIWKEGGDTPFRTNDSSDHRVMLCNCSFLRCQFKF